MKVRHFSAWVLGVVLFVAAWTDARAASKEPEGPQLLTLEGAPPAYYYPPEDRRGQHPVVVYLHGRGGFPEQDCRKWAKVAREFGWLLCPSGPEDRGGGARGWSNNWMAAKSVVEKALAELRKKEGHKVQLRGNTLIGFSEGAFVAMNIGVREPRTYNRWLILSANDSYWGGEGQVELRKNRGRIRRVYLMTGGRDEVVASTQRVFDLLDEAGVHVIMRTPEDLMHEVPADHMRHLYRRPLRWLNTN